MTHRPIFHLSIPVADLESAKRFYVEVLGGVTGRQTAQWLDVLLWGHQLTLQHSPVDVLPASQQGKRHFGVILPWDQWEREAKRIKDGGTEFLQGPTMFETGTPQEHAKFYLQDPSGNVIEIKCYRDVRNVLGLVE